MNMQWIWHYYNCCVNGEEKTFVLLLTILNLYWPFKTERPLEELH